MASTTSGVTELLDTFLSSTPPNASTTTYKRRGGYDDDSSSDVFMWMPLIFVMVFSMFIIGMIVLSRFSFKCNSCCHSRRESEQQNYWERNVNDGFTPDEEAVPETPPPSYSSISRQISTASTISQSSQQLEVPPAYDEAINMQETSTSSPCPPPGNVANSTSKPSSSILSRFRIFSRSLSSGDRPQPRRGSLTSSVTGVGVSVQSQQTLHTIVGLPHLEDAHDQTQTEPDNEHSYRTWPTAEQSGCVTAVQSTANSDRSRDGDTTAGFIV